MDAGYPGRSKRLRPESKNPNMTGPFALQFWGNAPALRGKQSSETRPPLDQTARCESSPRKK
eukprot:5781177-Pyramimonas_sp.AAC.1